MPRITTNWRGAGTDQSFGDVEQRAIVSRMTCACAETAAYADAPMARALFHRVEAMKQPPELAARALGIKPGDAAYLLTGMREDIARDLVLLLGAGCPPSRTAKEKEMGDE